MHVVLFPWNKVEKSKIEGNPWCWGQDCGCLWGWCENRYNAGKILYLSMGAGELGILKTCALYSMQVIPQAKEEEWKEDLTKMVDEQFSKIIDLIIQLTPLKVTETLKSFCLCG